MYFERGFRGREKLGKAKEDTHKGEGLNLKTTANELRRVY